VDRWFRYLSAQQYWFIMLGTNRVGNAVIRAPGQAVVLPWREFGPALALAVPGAVALRAAAPGLLPGAGLILAALTLPLPCPVTDIQTGRYYLPCYALLAILIGLGAARLLSARPAWGLAALAVLAVPAWQNSRTCPRNRHYLAYDFAFNQLLPLPRSAILFCESGDELFTLFYLHDVLLMRPDTDILSRMPYVRGGASLAHLKRIHPDLVFPDFAADLSLDFSAMILANAPRRRSFFAPGCTGYRPAPGSMGTGIESRLTPGRIGPGSRLRLVPEGLVFGVHDSRTDASLPRFPALRLRGAADAARYADMLTLRVAREYASAMEFHGSRALELGDLATAKRYLSQAMRLPMETSAGTAVLGAILKSLDGRGLPRGNRTPAPPGRTPRASASAN
jgi:hypothetical protein